MTMTLRRSDSLPTRLRAAPVPSVPDNAEPVQKIPDSNTVPNISETPAREEVIATWKSLHTDVKKIKNGFAPKNEQPKRDEDKSDCVTQSFIPTNACHVRDGRKRISYDTRQVEVRPREENRGPLYHLDTGQTGTIECGRNSTYRRRSLLQRLLSWRTPECDCREKYEPRFQPVSRLRSEDLLCTCGVSSNRFKFSNKFQTNPERGRSKSVGYEAAREVAQFRRLVQCVACNVLCKELSIGDSGLLIDKSCLWCLKCFGALGVRVLARLLALKRRQHCVRALPSRLPAATTQKVDGVGPLPWLALLYKCCPTVYSLVEVLDP